MTHQTSIATLIVSIPSTATLPTYPRFTFTRKASK